MSRIHLLSRRPHKVLATGRKCRSSADLEVGGKLVFSAEPAAMAIKEKQPACMVPSPGCQTRQQVVNRDLSSNNDKTTFTS